MKIKTEFKFKFTPQELAALVGICFVAYSESQNMTEQEVALADFFIDQFGDLHEQMVAADEEEEKPVPVEVIH